MESRLQEEKQTGQELYRRARRRIPGGTQLLSKRPEMFLPEQWPSYYSRAKGADVWDLDGRKFTDMSYMGIGACVLGYADDDVDAAVREAIDVGTMTTLNCPEEVELADLLCELHPWADMVRYTRAGGEALSVAVRIARAHTGRDRIAFCGYHGWHDWYLAANLSESNALGAHLLTGLEPSGVPSQLSGTARPFHFNQIEELETLLGDRREEFAAIVVEPVRNYDPETGFLERIKEIAEEIGAVLIFDEVTSGLRLNTGGVHMIYGVSPHMAVFAKAMANGYPMAAIIGTGDVMEAAQGSFISSTFWTERIGPVAALATIRKHRDRNVSSHLIEIGKLVQQAWRDAATKSGLAVSVTGIPPLGHFSFDYPNGLAMRTLFTQMMLEAGFLATGAFYAAYAHQESDVARYAAAADEAFGVIAAAHEKNEVESLLKGPVAHAGFYRLS
ncbi:MAG TPA: aminotransferase class III-fold pyridoxal phosphate-dependent enzyme [Pyrinomonadaceae bacterium]|nr:aminotransferase class III-fold pyridoxal phosphate-dependent enzyme [Pyrinomonadaceae bacterium]